MSLIAKDNEKELHAAHWARLKRKWPKAAQWVEDIHSGKIAWKRDEIYIKQTGK